MDEQPTGAVSFEGTPVPSGLRLTLRTDFGKVLARAAYGKQLRAARRN